MIKNPHDLKKQIEKIIDYVGPKIIVATPLGLGKPIQFLNALYDYAKKDSCIDLTIITALSVVKPKALSGLNNFIERVYGDYEDLQIEIDRRAEQLPPNIRVVEFFLAAGAYLNNSVAQRNLIYTNYTYVIRDILSYNINILATMLASDEESPERLSFSCNTDLSKEIIKAFPNALLIGQVNKNLPYMYGPEAEISADKFFIILKNEDYNKKLFSVPKQAIGKQEYLIGLYASSLIPDDGCLQIGIGNLSDALVFSLILRHTKNKIYRNILDKLYNTGLHKNLFDAGLFALTEMLVDGYLELYNAGILKKSLPHDNKKYLAHAGFFLGSNKFYEQLNSMPKSERQKFSMRSISEINQLYGNELIKREQRKNASFVNSCLKVTLLGEVISDSLPDGRTISGVGGQYNFVVMANELEDAHSIMLCHSTYQKNSHVESNIVWNSSPVTIPRHLRDIVVTEYGIAYLRGKTDEEVIKAMLNIADSRFQKNLLREAKKSKKIPKSYKIPGQFTNNLPKNILDFFKQHDLINIFSDFPFGTELEDHEIKLIIILKKIQSASRSQKINMIVTGLLRIRSEKYNLLLKQVNLSKTSLIKDTLYRLLLLGAQ